MAEEAGCPTSTGISWVLTRPSCQCPSISLSSHLVCLFSEAAEKASWGKENTQILHVYVIPASSPYSWSLIINHLQKIIPPLQLTRLPLFWLESTQPTMSPARVYCNALYSMIYRFIIVRCKVWFIFLYRMIFYSFVKYDAWDEKAPALVYCRPLRRRSP